MNMKLYLKNTNVKYDDMNEFERFVWFDHMRN